MALRFLIGLWMLLLSLSAHAQSFEDGYQSYVKNLFPVAEFQFKSALKKASSDEDRAFILKFIGICQYMRGDKKNANVSFQQSLTLDRNVQIDEEEVLDPSVVSFFNAIKSRMPPPASKTVKRTPAPQPKAQPSTAEKSSASKPVAKTKKKKKAKAQNEDSLMAIRDGIQEEPTRPVSILQFLPLGIPQLHDRSYMWGGIYGAGQLASLYMIFDASQTIEDRKGLNDLVANKEGLTDEQRQAFFRDNNAFINKVKSQKSMGLAAFGALWTASVVHSLVFSRSESSSLSDRPREPRQGLSPIVEANRHGGAYGLSFQTELK